MQEMQEKTQAGKIVIAWLTVMFFNILHFPHLKAVPLYLIYDAGGFSVFLFPLMIFALYFTALSWGMGDQCSDCVARGYGD